MTKENREKSKCATGPTFKRWRLSDLTKTVLHKDQTCGFGYTQKMEATEKKTVNADKFVATGCNTFVSWQQAISFLNPNAHSKTTSP